MPVEALPFFHAAHEVREAFGALQLVSWLAIGLGAGVLVLTWGKIFAWLRTPEARPPSVERWGIDDDGYYFELSAPGEWSLEMDDGSAHSLELSPDGTLRAAVAQGRPVAVLSSEGARLPL